MNNQQIATELMAGCQSDEEWGEDSRKPWTDHQSVADAILDGTPPAEILEMPELDSWPETREWLESNLPEDIQAHIV